MSGLTFPIILLALVLLPRGLRWLRRGLFLWAWAKLDRGDASGALQTIRLWERLPGRDARVLGLALRASATADLGDTKGAVHHARELLGNLTDRFCPWFLVNVAINTFVNAGLYKEAYEAPTRWSKKARARGRQRDPENHAVAQVNRAEALHNMGHDMKAHGLLDVVDGSPDIGALGVNGSLCLRAWIIAAGRDESRYAEAQSALDRLDAAELGPSYQAELQYARAALALARGHLEAAEAHAKKGLESSIRAASERNGRFLLGAIAHAAGDAETARTHLEAGASSRYVGQSATGLLLLSQIHDEWGNVDESRRCLQRLLEQDPESRHATEARERLATTRRADAPRQPTALHT